MPIPDDYEATCHALGHTAGQAHAALWLGLGGILAKRADWYFSPPGDGAEAAWCFGVAGEARLVITADGPRAHLYDADNDKDLDFDEPGVFVAWLDEHEAEHEGLSPLGRELFDHLLPRKVEEWSEEQGNEE